MQNFANTSALRWRTFVYMIINQIHDINWPPVLLAQMPGATSVAARG